MKAEPSEIVPESQEVDLARAKEIAGFIVRTPRRRPFLASALLLIGTLMTLLANAAWPRTYSTQVRILTQRNLVLPSLGNPNRAVPREADNPTKSVPDIVLQHDNLTTMIDEVDLLERWESRRPWALRWKDVLVRPFATAPTPEQRMSTLIGVLEKRITVVADDATITITVEWTDPQTSYEIASSLQNDFIDARYDADVSTINDALGILREHAQAEHDVMDAALVDLAAALGAARPSVQSTAPALILPPVATPDRGLMRMVEDKRAAMTQMMDEHHRQVADLDRKLTEALVTLAPAHPTVIALRAQRDAARATPPELSTLQREEAGLLAQLGAPPRTTPLATTAYAPRASREPPEDPVVTLARTKLLAATQKYMDLQDRIDAAQIELDVTRAAFKHRYSIVRPAEVPRLPRRPQAWWIAIGGALFAILCSFLMPALLDLARGRFLERWQVERKLKIPILGEMDVT